MFIIFCYCPGPWTLSRGFLLLDESMLIQLKTLSAHGDASWSSVASIRSFSTGRWCQIQVLDEVLIIVGLGGALLHCWPLEQLLQSSAERKGSDFDRLYFSQYWSFKICLICRLLIHRLGSVSSPSVIKWVQRVTRLQCRTRSTSWATRAHHPDSLPSTKYSLVCIHVTLKQQMEVKGQQMEDTRVWNAQSQPLSNKLFQSVLPRAGVVLKTSWPSSRSSWRLLQIPIVGLCNNRRSSGTFLMYISCNTKQ